MLIETLPYRNINNQLKIAIHEKNNPPRPRRIPTVRTGQKTMDWFIIGKGVCQGYILSRLLFNLYAEYIMQNARLDEAQAEIRLPGDISITSAVQMTPPLWHKVKRNKIAYFFFIYFY